jgi:hypothetical protein
MRKGKSHRSYKAIIGEVQVMYWNFNRKRCGSGAFEHDCGPFRRPEQNVCPQERTLKGGIAPSPAYVADLEASGGTVGDLEASRGTVGNFNIGVLGTMYKDENVSEQDVWKTRDRGEGITIGPEGLDTTRVERLR